MLRISTLLVSLATLLAIPCAAADLPGVEITYPHNNDVLTPGQELNFSYTVQRPDTAAAHYDVIEFFIGLRTLGADSNLYISDVSPGEHLVPWVVPSTLAVGTYHLALKAYYNYVENTHIVDNVVFTAELDLEVASPTPSQLDHNHSSRGLFDFLAFLQDDNSTTSLPDQTLYSSTDSSTPPVVTSSSSTPITPTSSSDSVSPIVSPTITPPPTSPTPTPSATTTAAPPPSSSVPSTPTKTSSSSSNTSPPYSTSYTVTVHTAATTLPSSTIQVTFSSNGQLYTTSSVVPGVVEIITVTGTLPVDPALIPGIAGRVDTGATWRVLAWSCLVAVVVTLRW